MIKRTQMSLTDTLKKLKFQLMSCYQDRVVKIILFGSQARGDAEPTSDIDVLVILTGNVNPATEILKNSPWISELCLETEQVINCIYLSDLSFTNKNTALLRNIRQEGIFI